MVSDMRYIFTEHTKSGSTIRKRYAYNKERQKLLYHEDKEFYERVKGYRETAKENKKKRELRNFKYKLIEAMNKEKK